MNSTAADLNRTAAKRVALVATSFAIAVFQVISIIALAASVALAASGALTASAALAEEGEQQSGHLDKPLIISDGGDAVRELLFAREFQLTEPYRYEWSAERQRVTGGYLLVLSVDPEFIKPRQTDVPVLFVGSLPAEVVNVGYQSGNIIALIPGVVDLATTPIFFGSYELPEQIDAARGEAELALALQKGILPFSQVRIDETIARFTSREELHIALGNLIEQFSPEETERARQYQGITR